MKSSTTTTHATSGRGQLAARAAPSCLWLPALAVAIALHSPALADVPAAPASSAAHPSPPGALADAMGRGHAARRAGRWAEAEAAYRAAWALEARADIAGELGVCELALGKPRDAAEHLHLGLEDAAALSPDQARRFKQAQAIAERKVGRLAISVDPTDAEVLVAGVSLGEPRLTYLVFVEPGTHTVRARLAGHGESTATVEAAPGSTPLVALRLPRAELRAAPSPRGPSPARPAATPADPGDSPATALRPLGFAAAGLGLTAGAGLVIAAAIAHGDVKDRAAAMHASSPRCREPPSAPCRDLADLITTRDRLAGAAIISFIASGALGAVTASSFWWTSDAPPPAARLRVSPLTTARRQGILLEGQW